MDVHSNHNPSIAKYVTRGIFLQNISLAGNLLYFFHYPVLPGVDGAYGYVQDAGNFFGGKFFKIE
jgi:hypothetical protein